MATRPRRRTRWTPAVIPVGVLVMALGAWAFFAPLVGPYFNYGFFTSRTWVFSAEHWELLLGPGIAIALGGLLMSMPAKGLGHLGGLVALAGGVWLLLGPVLFPLWTAAAGHVAIAVPHSAGIDALLWIGYFYGTGALVTYLCAFAHGLLSRRTVIEEGPVIEETPVERERSQRVTTTV